MEVPNGMTFSTFYLLIPEWRLALSAFYESWNILSELIECNIDAVSLN